jgi:hypothetical protein
MKIFIFLALFGKLSFEEDDYYFVQRTARNMTMKRNSK